MTDAHEFDELSDYLRRVEGKLESGGVRGHEYGELIDYLKREGQTDAEIEKILARVRQYEVEMKQDSIMDAIGDGSLDLSALIKEALES